ncbi:hypothetical protein [Lactobacillus sp. ESL0681]|uniref:hypothetical protein n=1 Tax=Lactobacillus sp. ESL0681 TaxID=2983211 RepID=UPI0023F895C0|nr:hypothetical protein [Lactobacillus sp. ESL0681]WEV41198.1 hypothetical protein OZX59_04575 [Lactobacillus sp. ESL0681]
MIKTKNINKNTLLEVYSKSDGTEDFLLGYLVDEFEDYYIFQAIDTDGCLDSYVLYNKQDIKEITTDNDYTKAFQYYVNYQKQNNSFDNLKLQNIYDVVPKTSILEILEYCCKNGLVITVYQAEDDYYEKGKALSVDDEILMIDQESYNIDFGIEDKSKNTPIKIKNIMSIDIISKENFLYGQYLHQN